MAIATPAPSRSAAAGSGQAPAGAASIPFWLPGLLLFVLTVGVYARVWHAGFVWDDDAHVTRPELFSLHGLWRIWFEPGATQQYYPALHSAFWIEHFFFGDSSAGYHVLNVLLHATAALLLLRVTRTLAMPGALFAALLFAVHPVCVESVAWVSEQKNTLSAVLYFLSTLAYLRFDTERRAGAYSLATALFVLALATKTVTATLPAALLVVIWWRRGRLDWKCDWRPLLPWFVLSAVAGFTTAWMERTSIGATGEAYSMGIVERFLLAGRAAWFYLGKLAVPVDLNFIYPHWDVDRHVGWQYLFPVALLAALGALFAIRSRMRGPLAAALLYVGTLSPALGFVDVFPFMYSYVADHFQYLAAAALIPAVVAGLAGLQARLDPTGRIAVRLALTATIAGLGALSWRQSAIFADADTLWRTTIARNPRCWMARNNLGADLLRAGRVDEAVDEIQQAVALNPRNAASHANLGYVLQAKGRPLEALAEFRSALAIQPDNAEAHTRLAAALLQVGQIDEAIGVVRKGLAIDANSANAHLVLGNAFMQTGRIADAERQFNQALSVEPGNVEARTNLGTALAQLGRTDDAISELEHALTMGRPTATTHISLGNVFFQNGRLEPAIAHFRRALEIDSRSAPAHNNLGLALLEAAHVDEAVGHFQQALAINPNYVEAHRNLGAAYFKLGRLDEADLQFQEALKLK